MTEEAPLEVAQPNDEEEFARLPAPRRPRSAIAATLVVALSALVIWHLKDDLRYALSAGTPREVSLSGLNDNTYVTLSGTPDRAYALSIEPRGEKSRQVLARLIGSDNRVFVWEAPNAERTTLADRWSGRVRHIDALPYAEAIREYYRSKIKARRFFAPEAVREAQGDPTRLRDRTGLLLGAAPSTVSVDVAFTDGYLLSLAREKFPAPKDAEYELGRLGVAGSFDHETKEDFVFAVTIPRAKRDAEMARLEPLGVLFAPHRARYDAKWSDLGISPDTLSWAPGKQAKWTEVVNLSVEAPIAIPGDAWVLLDGKRPRDFTWTLFVTLLLVAFSSFNVWYLWRSGSSTR